VDLTGYTEPRTGEEPGLCEEAKAWLGLLTSAQGWADQQGQTPALSARRLSWQSGRGFRKLCGHILHESSHHCKAAWHVGDAREKPTPCSSTYGVLTVSAPLKWSLSVILILPVVIL
jgi:hypothetical protein